MLAEMLKRRSKRVVEFFFAPSHYPEPCSFLILCFFMFCALHDLIGQPGWGIAWYINGTLVPELVVERGRTYTFLVYGGSNPVDASNYHPFYITDSRNGGRLLNTQEQRQVYS